MADSDENKKDSVFVFPSCPTYDSPSFSNLLKSVFTSASPLVGFQGQNGASQNGTIGVIKPKVTRVQLKGQTKSPNPSEQHPEITIPNPPMTPHKEVPRLVSPEQKSDHFTPPSNIAKEQPAIDGYSWRKYGQKQVKNSNSSRSYYRCANSSCTAKKKVQRCDRSGNVINIIYIGDHNHEIVGNSHTVSRTRDDSAQKVQCDLEDSRQFKTEQNSSSSSNGGYEGHDGNKLESMKLFADAEVQQKHDSEPGSQKRLNEASVNSTSVFKANKESKTVVHSSADVAVSSDGYRWRKYGQKTVKGNTHSRSYYRCTFSGCSARKQVERAPNDAKATIVTCLGKHDHEKPVLKRQKVSGLSSQPMKTERSIDFEGDFTDEEVLELGGKEVLESARTLLTFSALEPN